jgi:hypothetical protein
VIVLLHDQATEIMTKQMLTSLPKNYQIKQTEILSFFIMLLTKEKKIIFRQIKREQKRHERDFVFY